ncbi:MAG: UDP-N-acetylmuramoyl-L-alanyl-D-glutamate--2,6-diaminopimelate ligase [Nitrospirota bacterium]|nr:UDP-N-acetylmuramoyl-L-alanyl-D-glutamate--2,6-diaminopimelate ligase [Nitrospirota bacterium]
MTLATLLEQAGIASVDAATGALEVNGVVYDSRAVRPGDLFVAVSGFTVDGHDYVNAAARNGAVCAVVTRRLNDVSIPQILVTDARSALADLAVALHADPTVALTLVGITGTNGKTTTSYLVESILDAAGHVTGLSGTVETRLAGTPLDLPGDASHRTTPESSDLQALFARMVREGATACVMEVSSHALSLNRVRGCRFDVGVFCNLTPDHLDFHPTMDDYFAAKAQLFADLPPGRAVINVDDPWGRKLAASLSRPVTFGLGHGALVTPLNLEWNRSGIRFALQLDGKRVAIESPLVGLHNVSNLLAAAATGHALGLSPEAIGDGLAAARAVPGRLEPVEAGQPFTVLVDYAHTADALERLLEAMRPLVADRPKALTTEGGRAVPPTVTGGRVLVVCGAGGDRDRSKRQPMGAAAAKGADMIFITADNPRSEDPAAICAEMEKGARAAAPDTPCTVIVDREEAIRAALSEASEGDLVLIAGKGHETEQIIGNRTLPFDDREVARRVLAERFGSNA